MLLTKDNLLRFVRQNKYTTPTQVASDFETSTMIASAALSELAKENSIKITNLKLSSSPYYYDNNQRESLVELGEKHFSGNELNIFNKLRESQLINNASLTIPEQLAISKISDFAKPLDIKYDSSDLKFWVWYLRDINETREQILDYLKGSNSQSSGTKKSSSKEESKITKKVEVALEEETKKIEPQKEKIKEEIKPQPEVPVIKENSSKQRIVPEFESPNMNVEKDKVEEFIENYLHSNYLKIEEKDKLDDGYLYSAILKVNNITIHFDCRYFSKKPQEIDIIKFYTSSMNPKLVFIENAPKKLFKLSENLENLELVNI